MARTPLASLLNYVRRLHYAATVELSDYELLQQFASKHEEAAFEALVRRHASLVWSVCRRLLDNEHDAEDAFQAVFLVLLRKSSSLRVGPSLANWLHSVALRIAQKSRVTLLRRRLREMRAETPHCSDPFAAVESRDLRTALDEELDRLPEKYRAPLVLCYLEGMTYTQAARQLGWPDGTVCGRLARARELLRQRLTRRGLTLTGPALIAAMTESSSAPAASLAAVTRMASLFALGEAVAGAVSLPVATLAQDVLHAMSIAKLKTLAVLAVALGLSTAGAGLATSHFLALQPPETQIAAIAKSDKPKSEKMERTDLFGDPLPPQALVRMGTVRFRHPDLIGKVASAPDGKTLAAAGFGGIIRLYDLATGKTLHQFQAKASKCPSIVFAPDGKTLACLGTNVIQIWDVETGKELRHFTVQAGPPQGAAEPLLGGGQVPNPLIFSPDGRLLAAVASDQSVRVWEVKTGKELVQLDGHRTAVGCLAFSPDGKTLFAGSVTAAGAQAGSVVRVWNIANGEELKKVSLHRPGAPLCFSPDGKTLLAVESNQWWWDRKQAPPPGSVPVKEGMPRVGGYGIVLFDVDNGKVHLQLEPMGGGLRAASFSPDGKIITVMHEGDGIAMRPEISKEVISRIKGWETATGKQIFDFPALASSTLLAFAPDGKKLAAASSSSLHIWDLQQGQEQEAKSNLHDSQVSRVAFSPDGQTLASASADHTIALWDAATGKQRLRLRGHVSQVSQLVFSPDGKLLASASGDGDDQTIHLWDVASGKEIHRHEVPHLHWGPLGRSRLELIIFISSWIAFTENGKVLASCGSDGSLRRWDVASGKELFNKRLGGLPALLFDEGNISGPRRDTHDPVFTPDGRMLAFSMAGTIYIANVAAGQTLFQFKKDGSVLALSPDGKTLLCRMGNCIQLMEVASGRDLHKVDLPPGIDPGAISPSGRIWGPTKYIAAGAFSPDGRIIAVSVGETQATIRLFNVATGKELLRLQGHQAYVPSLAFSPDGTKLASGQRDTTALIWDVSAARRELARKALTPRDLERLWTELRDKDAAKAHAALWALVAAPEQTVPFLKEHLHAVPRATAKQLHRWIADLDTDDFARREQASRNLAKLGSEAEPALRKALEAKPALEMHRRVQALLDGLAYQTEMTPDALRQLRAIQVLEQIGTPGARQVLSSLAKGAPAAPATRDAAAALARFNRGV